MPQSLGRIGQLGYLDVSGNMLTGTLPALASSQLITLRLAENFLSGTIPASYGEHYLHQPLLCAPLDKTCRDPAPGMRRTACQVSMRFTQSEPKHSCYPELRATQLREGPCAGSMNNLVSMELEGNQLEGTVPAGMLPAHAAAWHVLLMMP